MLSVVVVADRLSGQRDWIANLLSETVFPGDVEKGPNLDGEQRYEVRGRRFRYCGVAKICLATHKRRMSVREAQAYHLRSRRDRYAEYLSEIQNGVGWESRRFVCHCGLTRLCDLCRRRWIRIARDRITPWLTRHKWSAKFLTLTTAYTKSVGEVPRLTDLAVKLCSGHWNTFVLVCEILPKGDLWYVHFHSIVAGLPVPQAQLSEEWKALTGDSYIVDIRRIKPQERRFVAAYVTKYLTKPLKSSEALGPEKAVKMAVDLYHRRLLRTKGFKGIVSTQNQVPTQNRVDENEPSVFTCSGGLIPELEVRLWVFTGYEWPEQVQVVRPDG